MNTQIKFKYVCVTFTYVGPYNWWLHTAYLAFDLTGIKQGVAVTLVKLNMNALKSSFQVFEQVQAIEAYAPKMDPFVV